jgi:hypothetical protein
MAIRGLNGYEAMREAAMAAFATSSPSIPLH